MIRPDKLCIHSDHRGTAYWTLHPVRRTHCLMPVTVLSGFWYSADPDFSVVRTKLSGPVVVRVRFLQYIDHSSCSFYAAPNLMRNKYSRQNFNLFHLSKSFSSAFISCIFVTRRSGGSEISIVQMRLDEQEANFTTEVPMSCQVCALYRRIRNVKKIFESAFALILPP